MRLAVCAIKFEHYFNINSIWLFVYYHADKYIIFINIAQVKQASYLLYVNIV